MKFLKVILALIVMAIFAVGCDKVDTSSISKLEAIIGQKDAEIAGLNNLVRYGDSTVANLNAVILKEKVETKKWKDKTGSALSDASKAQAQSVKLQGDISALKSQVDQLQKLIKVQLITIDNQKYQRNQDMKDWVIAEGEFQDSLSVLQSQLDYAQGLLKYISEASYILDVKPVQEHNAEVQENIREAKILYKQCIDGRMKDIGPCTCNDLRGDLRYWEGQAWVLNKFIGITPLGDDDDDDDD